MNKPVGDMSVFSDALALHLGCSASRDTHPSAEGMVGEVVTINRLGIAQ